MSEQTNTIYSGDNIEVLSHLPDGSIDLIYADPPFFSNREYEVLWGDGYELRSFEDRWKGGIENYTAWMAPRLKECHRILKDNGSMYLHCDWHANAHLRILMDKIFGQQNFLNEIVWYYRRWNIAARLFARNHEYLLFYAKKSGIQTFNNLYIPKSEKSSAQGKTWKSVFNKEGKRSSIMTDVPTKGAPMPDVWDISFINPMAKERLGYPTQKPEALLERIINASSNPTDILLDPFCGCGTSIAVAHKLGRRWIGIDVSPTACKLMAKRMQRIGAKNIRLIGMPRTIEELKQLKPFEFQNWVFEKLHGRVNPKKTGDMGIDGWINLDVPTQVKQSEDIGRVEVDKFETAIKRYGKKQGVIVAFSFGGGAYEEVARVKNQEFPPVEITLKKVGEILNET